MTNLWVGAIVLAPLLISGRAYADGVGTILKADEIDSTRVKVGAFAVVVHGLGERRRVSGMWDSLETARGYIQTIGGETLTIGLGRKRQPKSIALYRIQTLVLVGEPDRKGELLPIRPEAREVKERTVVPFSGKPADRIITLIRGDLALAEEGDSLNPKEKNLPFDIEDAGLRWLAKVAAGTGSGIVFTVIAIDFLALTWNPDPGTSGHEGTGIFIFSTLFGSSIGFPLGVSWVDPYDSFPKTLLAGVVSPVSVLLINRVIPLDSQIVVSLVYIGPAIGSLIASEVWRKPLQDRRVSLELAPTFNGGLSAVATLRF